MQHALLGTESWYSISLHGRLEKAFTLMKLAFEIIHFLSVSTSRKLRTQLRFASINPQLISLLHSPIIEASSAYLSIAQSEG